MHPQILPCIEAKAVPSKESGNSPPPQDFQTFRRHGLVQYWPQKQTKFSRYQKLCFSYAYVVCGINLQFSCYFSIIEQLSQIQTVNLNTIPQVFMHLTQKITSDKYRQDNLLFFGSTTIISVPQLDRRHVILYSSASKECQRTRRRYEKLEKDKKH